MLFQSRRAGGQGAWHRSYFDKIILFKSIMLSHLDMCSTAPGWCTERNDIKNLRSGKAWENIRQTFWIFRNYGVCWQSSSILPKRTFIYPFIIRVACPNGCEGTRILTHQQSTVSGSGPFFITTGTRLPLYPCHGTKRPPKSRGCVTGCDELPSAC